MSTKRRTCWMGTLAGLLLAGAASAGQGVDLEFKHERRADRPMIRLASSEVTFGEAMLSRGQRVDLDLRREDSRRFRAARTGPELRSLDGERSARNATVEEICAASAVPTFVAVILGLDRTCN